MSAIRLGFLSAACCLHGAAALAASPAVLELTTAKGTFQGRSLAHDDHECWLLENTGEIARIPLKEVTSFQKVAGESRPLPVVEMRSRLQKEYGKRMEVVARGQYVVCAPAGLAAPIAELMVDTYNSFWSYFSRRDFRLDKPVFPLVVIVFPTRQEFAAYATADGTPPSPTLKGYYQRLTNRVAVYVDAAGALASTGPTPGSVAKSLGSDGAPMRDTLVHEGIHQLAFNTGLHNRIGELPRWVVEGLAMLLEEDSRRDDASSRNASDRINRERYRWFMAYKQSRRPKKALDEFLADDKLFAGATLDAYSEGWALSFYLAETRPSQYAKYLKTIASREPFAPYDAAARKADFQAAFTKDLPWFEGQYLQYIDGLRAK